MRDHKKETARQICNAVLDHAVQQDEHLREVDERDRIDDKTVFIIKRQ
jgi:hypothetical protein